MNRNAALFALMCLVWGLTWWPVKVGAAHVPPIFLAAARFLVAGVLMLAWAGRDAAAVPRSAQRAPARHGAARQHRQLRAAVLGRRARADRAGGDRQFRDHPGLLAARQPLARRRADRPAPGRRDRARQRSASALLFATRALGAPRPRDRPGARPPSSRAWPRSRSAPCSTASAPSCRGRSPRPCRCSRSPAGRRCSAASAWPPSRSRSSRSRCGTCASSASWPTLPALLFLVAAGSLAGFTIYLRLLRDWGAFRAGLYAFVSPVIAVAVGVVALGERFAAAEGAGALLMFAAAATALQPAARR